MSNARPRRRSIFSGLLLILLGVLLQIHYLRGGFPVWELFQRWWPLLLILWGLTKLYDYMAARRSGEGVPRTITAGEVFLVLVLVLLLGSVAFYEWHHQRGPWGEFGPWPWEQTYSFSQELPPKPVPAGSRIDINTDLGDITVRPEEPAELRVVAKKSVTGADESDAERRAKDVTVSIAEEGGAYQVQPQESGERIQVDLEVHVPKQASVTAHTGRGSVQINGLAGRVEAEARGNIEIRDTAGDVSAEVSRGDVHIGDARGNVKVSGRGGQVEIADVKGDAALEGEFLGPIRLSGVAKGVRFVSSRTDLTVTRLSGRVETGSGRLEITDAPGDVSLVTRDYNVVLENVGGRVRIQNRNGDVELRFAQPPAEAIDVSTSSGSIALVLPAKSSFEIHAESRKGEIDSEFPELAALEKEEHGNTTLDGNLGTRGPQIRLKTTYGTIRLRKGK